MSIVYTRIQQADPYTVTVYWNLNFIFNKFTPLPAFIVGFYKYWRLFIRTYSLYITNR